MDPWYQSSGPSAEEIKENILEAFPNYDSDEIVKMCVDEFLEENEYKDISYRGYAMSFDDWVENISNQIKLKRDE
jgi:hypothetical protein